MKFQSYSQILSVVVYVTNFNMCNFIIITFSALKLQVALYFRNRLAPSVNIESRTVTLWRLVKKNIILYVFFKACRGISYMHLMKIILELKKKRKVMHAWKSLIYQKYCKISIFFLVYYPASWMSPVLYVHSYSAYFKSYGYSKPYKDMFFPLGYAMIL